MKRAAYLLFGLLSILPVAASANSGADRVRDRLNKLFFWQMAEELKLNPQQEKAMVATVQEMQQRRDTAIHARDEALAKLKDSKNAQMDSILDAYQKALEQLASLDAEEFRRLKEALGTTNLAHYYVKREQILERVRASLLGRK